MMTQLLLFNVTNGLIIGAFYVLMALGLSLILNLSNVINFAHGGFLVIGGYIAYTITPYIGFWGALLLAPPLTAVIGLAVERVLIRPLYGRDPLYSLLLTFGLAFMIGGCPPLPRGPAGKAGHDSGLSGAAFEQRSVFHHRLSPVHGGRGDDRGRVVVPAAALHPARRSHPRRHARPRDGRSPRHQRADAALAEFRGRHLSCRPQRRARGRTTRPGADHGHRPVDAELY